MAAHTQYDVLCLTCISVAGMNGRTCRLITGAIKGQNSADIPTNVPPMIATAKPGFNVLSAGGGGRGGDEFRAWDGCACCCCAAAAAPAAAAGDDDADIFPADAAAPVTAGVS